MNVSYESYITVVYSRGQRRTGTRIYGNMGTAKGRARKIAKELNLKPIDRRWNVERTKFAENSGLHGSWESKATRNYTTEDGKGVKIVITCA